METTLLKKIISYRIQREMKKMDPLSLILTKQKSLTPRIPTILTKTLSKKKSCK
jgi:hypothetical protein